MTSFKVELYVKYSFDNLDSVIELSKTFRSDLPKKPNDYHSNVQSYDYSDYATEYTFYATATYKCQTETSAHEILNLLHESDLKLNAITYDIRMQTSINS